MRFRNAVRLFTNNFSNVYRLLLFRLITGILCLSLVYVIVTLGLRVIIDSEESRNIALLVSKLFEDLMSANPGFEVLVEFRDSFISALGAFFAMLAQNVGSIVGSLIGVIAVYLLTRFLNGTATFAVGQILNDRMESYSLTEFPSAYFKNLGKSMRYHAIYVPLTFVYDVVSIAACWFFFFYTPSFLPYGGWLTVFVGLALTVTALVCLQTLKLTFVSAWIPAVVTDGRKVTEGMRESFRARKGFGTRFSGYLISIYLVVVCNLMFGIFTFGSFLLITVPASYFFFLCLQFVHYYEDTGKKFFLSFRKISGADGKPEGMGN